MGKRKGSSSTTPSLPALRDYQKEAIEKVHAAFDAGTRRQLVALPTATGKTRVFAEVIKDRGIPALILVHRDELIQQAIAELHQVAPDLRVGVVKAELAEYDAPVVIASVQTAHRANRLQELAKIKWHTVVVDEAHHTAAESYQKVLAAVRAFEDDGPLLLGVTATPYRHDAKELDQTFEETTYKQTIPWMVANNYLTDMRGVRVQLDIGLDDVKVSRGDYQEGALTQALRAAGAPKHVLQAHRKFAKGRKRTLVFTPGIELSKDIEKEFQKAGIKAEHLDGTTPIDARRAILARFKTGETSVVTNVGVLTEGFNEPNIDCMILARPTKSKGLYTQMVGRGTRKSPEKENCLYIDLVDNTDNHDLSMDAATLFDVGDHAETFERDGLRAALLEKLEADEKKSNLRARLVNMLRQAPVAWSKVGPDLFAVGLGKDRETSQRRGFVFLEGNNDVWRIIRLKPTAWNAYVHQAAVITNELDLDDAQSEAQSYLDELGVDILTRPDAKWRNRRPSEAMLRAARKSRIPVLPDDTLGSLGLRMTGVYARKAWLGAQWRRGDR